MSWINFFATKLNNEANAKEKISIDSDSLYVEHSQEETEERIEFLRLSTPAFMYALKAELAKQVLALNTELHQPTDRIQFHVDQEALQSMFITSNVELSRRIHDETSIEVSISEQTGEITESYRRHDRVPLRTEQLWLYMAPEAGLRVASDRRSFNAAEYAGDLITRFLKERLASREGLVKKSDRSARAK